jgi:transcriptional regulator with XRE-family HTH domain
MNNSTMAPHHGRNVKRMRDVMGVKQDALAHDLGLSQQAISLLEQKETLDAALIEKICVILGVPEEMITHMTDEGMMNIISSTFNDHSSAIGANNNCTFTFNPIDKLIETIEDNKKLYERLLTAEKEKNDLLMTLLEGKK